MLPRLRCGARCIRFPVKTTWIRSAPVVLWWTFASAANILRVDGHIRDKSFDVQEVLVGPYRPHSTSDPDAGCCAALPRSTRIARLAVFRKSDNSLPAPCRRLLSRLTLSLAINAPLLKTQDLAANKRIIGIPAGNHGTTARRRFLGR